MSVQDHYETGIGTEALDLHKLNGESDASINHNI